LAASSPGSAWHDITGYRIDKVGRRGKVLILSLGRFFSARGP
jgi:formamidopyrimidine-DNA glycosylase